MPYFKTFAWLFCSLILFQNQSVQAGISSSTYSLRGFIFSIVDDDVQNRTSFRCNKRDIVIKLSRSEKFSHIDDINNDGVIELWTVYYDGQENLTRLYQFNAESKCKNQDQVFLNYQIELEQDSFSLEDIDKDGQQELIVKKFTHGLYGTLYSRGKITWIDIYRFSPKLTLANNNYRSLFREKRAEIEAEIRDLHHKKEILEKTSLNDKEAIKIKIDEIMDQIRVYKSWIKKIDGMNVGNGKSGSN